LVGISFYTRYICRIKDKCFNNKITNHD
jgi:hypothetical protein